GRISRGSSEGDGQERRGTPRRARLQPGPQPVVERVLELRDFVHDHLGSRGLLHDLRPGLQQRRAHRDLVGLADHLRAHPLHRLVDVRARLGLSDGRRHLLVGVRARRQDVGLVHRLV
ncbi:MAG: Amino acid/metabolite permease in hypothetical Actinobacterial gene cluster; BAT1-like, partial [uncultured Solirubrobacteraceae bacterium]